MSTFIIFFHLTTLQEKQITFSYSKLATIKKNDEKLHQDQEGFKLNLKFKEGFVKIIIKEVIQMK